MVETSWSSALSLSTYWPASVIHIDLVTDMAMQKLLRREQRKIKDGAAATLVVFFQSKDCSWIRPDRIVAFQPSKPPPDGSRAKGDDFEQAVREAERAFGLL